MWEDGLPALIRSPAPPPGSVGSVGDEVSGGPALLCSAPLPADKDHISSGSFLLRRHRGCCAHSGDDSHHHIDDFTG